MSIDPADTHDLYGLRDWAIEHNTANAAAWRAQFSHNEKVMKKLDRLEKLEGRIFWLVGFAAGAGAALPGLIPKAIAAITG